MSLTPKERVIAAMNHEEPDRVPIVVGVSNATGIKMKTYQELKKILGIDAPDEYIYDWPELGTAKVDEETLQRLHVDVRGVLDLEPESIRTHNKNREPHAPYENSWGTHQIEISEGEWTSGAPPMKDAATIEEIEAYPWPDMDDPTRVAHCRKEAKRLAEENQYAIMGTPWLLFPFERAHGLQGMDTFLAGSLFIGASFGIYNNYLTLFLQSLESPSWLVGVITSIQAFVEIPVMLAVPALLQRFSKRRIILLGAIILPIRWLLYYFIQQPGWILPIQLVHGLPVVSFFVISVAFVDRLVDPKFRATGQALYATTVMGVGSGLGVYIAGRVIDAFGVREIWLVNVLFGLVGWVILSLVFSKVDTAKR